MPQSEQSWAKRVVKNTGSLGRVFPDWLYYDLQSGKVVRRTDKGSRKRNINLIEWQALKRYYRRQYRLVTTRALNVVFTNPNRPYERRVKRIIQSQMQELASAKEAIVDRRIPESMYAAVRGGTFEYIDFIIKRSRGEKAVEKFHAVMAKGSSTIFRNEFWNPFVKMEFEDNQVFDKDPEGTFEKRFKIDMLDSTWDERKRIIANRNKPPFNPENN